MQVREATVGPLFGTMDVSGCPTGPTVIQCNLHHFDRVVRNPERVGGNLTEDRVGPLADLGVRGQHAHTAAGKRFDLHNRRQVFLARSRETGAMHIDGESDAALAWRHGGWTRL